MTTGSALSLRGFMRCGSSLSAYQTSYAKGPISVMQFAHLGSSLSIRGASRLGSRASIFDCMILGSSMSIRAATRLGSTLSVLQRPLLFHPDVLLHVHVLVLFTITIQT